jgi:hypothetical protein
MRFVVDAVATVAVAAAVGVAMVMEPCQAFALYYPSTRLAPPPSTMTSSTTTTTTWSSTLRMADGNVNNGDEKSVMNKYSR